MTTIFFFPWYFCFLLGMVVVIFVGHFTILMEPKQPLCFCEAQTCGGRRMKLRYSSNVPTPRLLPQEGKAPQWHPTGLHLTRVPCGWGWLWVSQQHPSASCLIQRLSPWSKATSTPPDQALGGAAAMAKALGSFGTRYLEWNKMAARRLWALAPSAPLAPDGNFHLDYINLCSPKDPLPPLVSIWLIFMCVGSFLGSVKQFCLNMGVVSSQHCRNALGTFNCRGHCLGWT